MKKQTKQILFLAGLLVFWAAMAWRLKIIGGAATTSGQAAVAARTSKGSQQDNLLTARFHRVRSEMDALYHYRIKPVPIETDANPFRIPAGIEIPADAKHATAPEADKSSPIVKQQPDVPLASGSAVLKRAVDTIRIQGVVSLNGVVEVSIDGQFRREGDVFAVRLQSRLVLLKVKLLTPYMVTFSLEDASSGNPEQKVRLK